ncbi:hypothetical protein ACFSQ3_10040 [Sphingobacterium corticis]|uniref:PH domain-containing protein n=1 Tax=Sphingobacterium corticis TaxID=1812823 RepID=A0ABW5NML6_9SPHI
MNSNYNLDQITEQESSRDLALTTTHRVTQPFAHIGIWMILIFSLAWIVVYGRENSAIIEWYYYSMSKPIFLLLIAAKLIISFWVAFKLSYGVLEIQVDNGGVSWHWKKPCMFKNSEDGSFDWGDIRFYQSVHGRGGYGFTLTTFDRRIFTFSVSAFIPKSQHHQFEENFLLKLEELNNIEKRQGQPLIEVGNDFLNGI